MSFKIFTLQLFGGMKSVEAIEKKRKELLDDYIEFQKVESSDELKEYLSLEKEINSEVFKKKKVEIRNLRFKGSKEHNQLKEFNRLRKKSTIKRYFKVAKSTDLERFSKLQSADKLAEYNLLLKYVKGGQYASEKKNKENSEASSKHTRFKQLKADSDIKFFFKFGKSSLYKNYLNVVDSADLKKYNELETIVNSEEFKERKIYLEDKKKWEKSAEFKRQQEFVEMQKQTHFVKYFKNKGTDTFKFFEEWKVVFDDDFKKVNLDPEKWSTKSIVAEKLLGDNYVLKGDNHIFTDGNNISLNGNMSIKVKKEKITGKVWQMSAGFIPVEMDYSSGMISSWKSFWMEDGILEAKIKFDPAKQVVSSFYLAGDKELPRINLLEMGAKNRIGVLNVDGSGKADVNGMDISNLKKGKWYIFSVVKSGNNYSWKINEKEILSVQSSELNEKLHVNASSIVVNEVPATQLPVGFDIGWVKCYRKN